MNRILIRSFSVIALLFLGSCTFSGDPRKKETTEFVLNQRFYLYRVKSTNDRLTDIRLWDFNLIGDDGLHYKLESLPEGTSIYVYGNVSQKRSFYTEPYIQFYGTVRRGAKDYFFKAGMTQSEFVQLKRPWETSN
jgi:hypothetical protein